MNNNSILLINPDFEPSNSTNLNLLVKIGADTFSYAIIDDKRKLVHAVYDEQECEDGYEKFNERLKNDAYLQLQYQNVKVAAHTQNIVFVPQEFMKAEDKEQRAEGFDRLSLTPEKIAVYSKYFTDMDSKRVYVQPSLQQNFYTVFSLPASVEKLIDENWADQQRLQQNAGLIELATKLDQDSLIIDFTIGAFQLIYAKNNSVVFAQSYQFDGIDELTYYLLLIVGQLKINTDQTLVNVCGIIHQEDEKWNCLAKYFGNIELLFLSSDLDTNILDDMPAHYYTSLLALQQCG